MSLFKTIEETQTATQTVVSTEVMVSTMTQPVTYTTSVLSTQIIDEVTFCCSLLLLGFITERPHLFSDFHCRLHAVGDYDGRDDAGVHLHWSVFFCLLIRDMLTLTFYEATAVCLFTSG